VKKQHKRFVLWQFLLNAPLAFVSNMVKRTIALAKRLIKFDHRFRCKSSEGGVEMHLEQALGMACAYEQGSIDRR